MSVCPTSTHGIVWLLSLRSRRCRQRPPCYAPVSRGRMPWRPSAPEQLVNPIARLVLAVAVLALASCSDSEQEAAYPSLQPDVVVTLALAQAAETQTPIAQAPATPGPVVDATQETRPARRVPVSAEEVVR